MGSRTARHSPVPMLYSTYQTSDDLMTPLRLFADAALNMLQGPWEQFSRQIMGRHAIATLEMTAVKDRRISNYSKGMRQRIKVAYALVHRPEVVVLDEPLEGLDPRQRVRMIELFRRLGDEGR